MLKTLNLIKRLPKQTEESLNDAMGLIVQLEEPADILEWCRWVRKALQSLRFPYILVMTKPEPL